MATHHFVPRARRLTPEQPPPKAAVSDWEDTDKSDYQDSRGTYVIQELSDIAKTAEAKGFMVYYWNNPATNREERKLGYIELITGTDAYIGSGIYIP
ncbi:MAG: cache domain-containing protein [Polyangiaceae bacterium]|nr:cache domain-containing protein [Polyangiaceae bacterium]